MATDLAKKIIRLREKGFTYNEIAKKLNCAKSTVSYHATKEGIDDIGLKLESFDEKMVAKIRSYRETHTRLETAKKFDVSESSVKKYQVNKGRVKKETVEDSTQR